MKSVKGLISLCICAMWSGPQIIKLFSWSTLLSMKFVPIINLNLPKTVNSFLLNTAVHERFSANKYGFFIFISRKKFMLSWVEHEKFYNFRVRTFAICLIIAWMQNIRCVYSLDVYLQLVFLQKNLCWGYMYLKKPMLYVPTEVLLMSKHMFS